MRQVVSNRQLPARAGSRVYGAATVNKTCNGWGAGLQLGGRFSGQAVLRSVGSGASELSKECLFRRRADRRARFVQLRCIRFGLVACECLAEWNTDHRRFPPCVCLGTRIMQLFMDRLRQVQQEAQRGWPPAGCVEGDCEDEARIFGMRNAVLCEALQQSFLDVDEQMQKEESRKELKKYFEAVSWGFVGESVGSIGLYSAGPLSDTQVFLVVASEVGEVS